MKSREPGEVTCSHRSRNVWEMFRDLWNMQSSVGQMWCTDLWEKVWKFFVILEEQYHGEYDFILRADTDTWFSVNNFKSFAQYFNPKWSWYMGMTAVSAWPVTWQSGGNYALSAGTIERLVDVFKSEAFHGLVESRSTKEMGFRGDDPNYWCSASQTGWGEDIYLAECLRSIGIYPLSTLNENLQHRWSHCTLSNTKAMKPGKLKPGNDLHCSWYWVHQVEDHSIGEHCCDPNMIAFHMYKDKKTRKATYLELDRLYESHKMKDIAIPSRPRTFLFGQSLKGKCKNKHIQYKLKG